MSKLAQLRALRETQFEEQMSRKTKKPSAAVKTKKPSAKTAAAKKGKTAKSSPSITLASSEGLGEEEVKIGRPTAYDPKFVPIARKMCAMGATDYDLAQAFDVTTVTIWNWSTRYPEFFNAIKVEKGEFDERVIRSLAQRAVGYTFRAVKITSYNGEITKTEYDEHVPPDPQAARLWLTNRRKEEWRDRQELSGPNGGPLQILDMSRVSEEQLRDLAAAGLSGIGATRAGQAPAG
jgi:hypothetical protein